MGCVELDKSGFAEVVCHGENEQETWYITVLRTWMHWVDTLLGVRILQDTPDQRCIIIIEKTGLQKAATGSETQKNHLLPSISCFIVN
jgi:hypothetical protein